MATFPTLGTDTPRGMFIADKHLDQSHIRAMIAALPKLQPMISVLFLEAFYHDQDPRGITDIAAHLNERSFNWTNTLATDDVAHRPRARHKMGCTSLMAETISSSSPGRRMAIS